MDGMNPWPSLRRPPHAAACVSSPQVPSVKTFLSGLASAAGELDEVGAEAALQVWHWL